MIQSYIGSIDNEFTTAVYRDKNIFEVITFKRKLTGGMTSYATIENEKQLTEYARKIAVSFDLNGSINIQSRKLDDNFYIFEINPRLSSTIYIRDHFGFQDFLWWANNISTENIFDLEYPNPDTSGSAILGYQYKFFNKEGSKSE